MKHKAPYLNYDRFGLLSNRSGIWVPKDEREGSPMKVVIGRVCGWMSSKYGDAYYCTDENGNKFITSADELIARF